MGTKYQVAAGDTYPSLARQCYRDPDMGAALAAANHQPVTAELMIGQELVIPYITQPAYRGIRRHPARPCRALLRRRRHVPGARGGQPHHRTPSRATACWCPTSRTSAGTRSSRATPSRSSRCAGTTTNSAASVIEFANHLAGQQDIEVGQTADPARAEPQARRRGRRDLAATRPVVVRRPDAGRT